MIEPELPSPVDTEHPYVVLLAGVPTLRGTRLPVRVLVQLHLAGENSTDMLAAYPFLTAAAVADALAYYHAHRADLEQEIAAQHIDNVLPRTGSQVDASGFIQPTRQ